MGFETPEAVFYQIRRQHRNEEVREVIPADYEGILEDPSIEPTNIRAERALRGAVIARKVSQCSKNEQGANAHASFQATILNTPLDQRVLVVADLKSTWNQRSLIFFPITKSKAASRRISSSPSPYPFETVS